MGFFLATPEMHPPFSFLGALAYSFFYNLVSSLWEESMPYWTWCIVLHYRVCHV